MEKALEQVILIVLNSGIPVLLVNLGKNFIPQLKGKSDKVANVLIMALFVFGWFYGEYYDPNFLYDALPVLGSKVKESVEVLNGILALIISLGLAPKIYSWVKNRIPVFGKSFDE